MSETQPALEAFREALDRRRTLGDRKEEAVLLQNMGAAYHRLSEFSKALDYNNQSLAMYQSLGNRAGEGAALNSLGDIYSWLDDNEKALDCYIKSLAAFQDIKDIVAQSAAVTNIASVYNKLNEYSKALGYLNRSMELSIAFDTLLLEYSLGDDVSYAWLVSASGMSSFTLPKRAEIEAAAKKTHEWLASSNRTPQPEAMASLAKMVLAPLASELGNHRLLIVADGALEFVPFAALPDPNAPNQPINRWPTSMNWLACRRLPRWFCYVTIESTNQRRR